MYRVPVADGERWFRARLKRHLAELARLAVPVVIARLGLMTMTLVDTAMVGRFSTTELAYQSIGVAPVDLPIIASVGLLMGTLVLTATALGANSPRDCGMVWRRSMPYATLLGLFSLGLCFLVEPLLLASGQTADLARGGAEVAIVLGYGLPATLIYITSAFFLEGIKRPLPGMIAMIAANVLNILLNWLFVYGVGGLPAMGAVGSAWATTSVRVFLAACVVAYIWTMPDRATYGVRLRPTGGWRAWAAQRRIGYASGISIGMESAAFVVLTLYAGRLGVLALGSHSIALKTLAVVFMVALGLGSATAVRVGVAHGRRDYPDLALAGWTGFAVNSLAMLAIGVVFMAWPGGIAGLYTADADLLAVAAPLIAFSAYILIADGGQAVMANALRGRGDVWVPTASHMLSYFGVMVPLGWVLAFPLGRGVTGLFEAILIASLVSVTLLIARFQWLVYQDRRKRPEKLFAPAKFANK
ncbi:MAG: MATE family efflux transporter [Inquilinaceae bacterium]